MLIALLAALSLFAVACGGGSSEAATDQVDETMSEAAESAEPAEQESGEQEPTEDGTEDETVEEEIVVEDEASGTEDEGDPGSGSAPLAQVLSFALENSETQSYSFTQGMAMQMNIAGETMNIAPEEAYVFGEVDGTNMHMEVDMGVFMGAMMGAVGIDVTAAPFNEIFDGLGEARMETWSSDTTVVMDFSKFAAAFSAFDEGIESEMSEFVDGPVKVDITQLDGVDAAKIANEFGQGAQVTDPAALLQALRGVDAVTESGSDVVNGRDVSVFTADLPLTSYYEAIGIDLSEQLGVAAIDLPSEDSAMLDALLPALSEVEMALVVMVDEHDLVRRMETSIDMGAMLSAMFNNPEVLERMAAEEGQTVEELQAEMDEVLGTDMQIVIDTWQEFDNYGETVVSEPPEAVDITAEFDLAS